MRVLRCLIVIGVVCGLTGLAGATPVDFHMHILDPPPSFSVLPITSTPFPVSFTACGLNELPSGTADGCFAGVNRTGDDWVGLQLTFANNTALAGQLPNCSPAPPPADNIFASTDCTFDGSSYALIFTDGVIRNGDFFFITEDGVIPPEDFGTGTATVTVLTPEPAPVLLLSTGLILFVFLFNPERRRAVWPSLRS